MNLARSTTASTLLLCFVLIAAYGLLFSHTIAKLFHDLMLNDDYSHGLLIPFVSCYMIYAKRSRLLETQPSPAGWGLLVLAGAMVLHLTGILSSELLTSRIAMVVTLLGLCLYLWGLPITRLVALPVVYLIFMFPLPVILSNQVSLRLRLISSSLATFVMQFFGMPVYREGNILRLPNIQLEVVNACSGLRSVISLLALGAALAYFSSSSLPRRLAIFLAAIPAAILANSFRLLITASLSLHFNTEFTTGPIHAAIGILTFVLSMLVLAAVYFSLTRRSTSQ